MWRYASLLPIEEGPIRFPAPVGGTPLWAPGRLREGVGCRQLWLKDETRGPTGSNKDRATALVLEHGLRIGATTVTAASTGNVAASLAVGAAAAGLRAVIFVPASVDQTKLTLMLLAGALVVKVAAGYEAAFRLSREAAVAFGWLDRNTGVNPLTIEAKKTIAFEIWEQLGREMPDTVVAPVGDGATLSALAKGFRELKACGVAGAVPRMIGVQAEGCQPLVRAWRTGEAVRPEEPRTIADGIAVGSPACGEVTLREVRGSGGALVSVSDRALMKAVAELGQAGVLAEPAAAAGFAGLRASLEGGLVAPEGRTVVLVTGTILKTPHHAKPVVSPLHVQSQLSEVEEALAAEPRWKQSSR